MKEDKISIAFVHLSMMTAFSFFFKSTSVLQNAHKSHPYLILPTKLQRRVDEPTEIYTTEERSSPFMYG